MGSISTGYIDSTGYTGGSDGSTGFIYTTYLSSGTISSCFEALYSFPTNGDYLMIEDS